jgi:hypothetical protein
MLEHAPRLTMPTARTAERLGRNSIAANGVARGAGPENGHQAPALISRIGLAT